MSQDLTPQQVRLSQLLGPLVIVVALTGMAAAQGGYFPTSWGWATLGLAWPLGVAIVMLGGFPHVSRLALAFIAALSSLFLWILLSSTWSVEPWESVLDAERTLVYVVGVAFVLLVARRRAGSVYGAVLLAVFLVSAYALATRLFPDRLGVFDPIANYRLAEPIGYWNGLAVFAVMGTLLALGIAANGRSMPSKCAAAATLPFLLVTQYFTFGRAGWIALGVGLLAAIAFDRDPLRLITVALALAVPSAVAVISASRESPLTHIGAPLSEAADSGHRIALVLMMLSALSAATALAIAIATRRVTVSRRIRLAYSGLLSAAAVAVIATALVASSTGPIGLGKRAYDSFTSAAYVPPETQGNTTDLETRLFSLSGNGRAQFWRVAWHEYQDHPWLGSGAGTFQSFWLATPNLKFPIHDAHGLYIQTLAELGPIGLALMLFVLLVPLAAAARARPSPYVAGAAGAYVAFFVHAGVDWDWQLGGVTLVALACGALLVALRATEEEGAKTTNALGTVAAIAPLVPLTAFALVAAFGNASLAGSHHAIERQDWARGQQLARRARTWMPWSPEPWTALGAAQLGAGNNEKARGSFRQALRHGEREWRAWLGLAHASEGTSRTNALAEARRLNTQLELENK